MQAKEKHRNPHLLKMAKGRHCLLCIPGVCNGDRSTVVACHSNQQIHGKGMGTKAHDFWTVWGCSSCHAWLDQGNASVERKRAAFMVAHADQMIIWRRLQSLDCVPKKDQDAARWAVKHTIRAWREKDPHAA